MRINPFRKPKASEESRPPADFGVLLEKDKEQINSLLDQEKKYLRELRSIDDEIIAIQRSTHTTIPFLTPLHNYCRMKWAWYYKWHTNPASSKVHWGALAANFALVLTLISNLIFSDGIAVLAATTSSADLNGDVAKQWSSVANGVPSGNASIQLSQSSDKVSAGANAALNISTNLTIEAWVYQDGSNLNNGIIYKGSGASEQGEYSLQIGDGVNSIVNFRVNKSITTGDVKSTAAVGTGAWHHVAATYDGANIRVWIDGAMSGSKGYTTPISNTDVGLMVGNYYSGGYAFMGKIDDVRISSITRYTDTFTPPVRSSLETDNDTAVLYKFNEGAGSSIADSSSHSVTGTASGSYIWNNEGTTSNYQSIDGGFRQPSIPRGALNMSGGMDRVTFPTNTALNISTNLTVESWVYLSDANSNNGLVFKGGSGTQGEYSLGFYTGSNNKPVVRLNGSTSEGSGQLTANTALLTGRWYHVAMTYDGSKIKLWLNGTLDRENDYSTAITNTDVGGWVGSYFNGGYGLNGLASGVRISNSVRYTGSFTPAASLTTDGNTALLYNFTDGTGTSVTDASGNNITGTASGNYAWTTRDDYVTSATQNQVDDYNVATVDMSGGVATAIKVWVCGYRDGGANGISVDYNTGGGFASLHDIGETTTLGWHSYEWTGLSLNQTQIDALQIRLKNTAANGVHNYVYEMYTEITYNAGPAAASAVSIGTITTTGFTVGWTDNSSDETGFKIFISTTPNADCSAATYPGSPDYTAAADATSQPVTGKSVNTQYCAKVVATNGTGDAAAAYSSAAYTLANAPGTPTVGSATSSSLTVTLNQNSNPAGTAYAFGIDQDQNGSVDASGWVQANGTLGASAVWQDYTTWGGASGKSVTGLTASTTYYFIVKAKNGDNIETALSAAGNGATASAGTTISGTCQKYDRTTNCASDETIAVAVNGSIQTGKTATTNFATGLFTISDVTVSAGDVVTIFVDGVADSLEANAVTKYDGTGDITGMTLYEDHLTIGSGDNQTIANSDLDSYDNSVSSDEDIFFEVNADNDLSTDATDQTTQDTLLILANNTYRPDSGSSGNVGTTNVVINASGDITADGNTLTIPGNWTNSGTFSADTSTVNISGSGTSTFTGNTTFNSLSCTVAGKQLTFTAGSTQTIGGVLALTGTYSNMILLRSSANGSAYTITKNGTTSIDWVDVKDSTATNAITATDGTNNTGNTNWTFTYENRYWVSGNSQNWNSTSYWSKTSGGTNGASVPSTDNNVFFDGNGLGSSTLNISPTIRNLYNLGDYTGTLATNSTYGFTINGNVEWNKGILTLAKAATMSGSVTLGGTGKININHAQAIGNAPLVINGGTIDNSTASSITLTTNNQQTWNSGFIFGGTRDLNLGAGAVILGNDITVTTNQASYSLIIGGVISGNYSLTKAGTGFLTLAGANTFGGSGKSVTLSAGRLNINNATALGNAANVFIINGGTIDNNSGSTVTLANNYPMQWNNSFLSNGTGSLVFGSGAVTLGAHCTITTNIASSPLTVGGVISGNYNIIKAGNGVLTLSGDNTFVGSVTVSAGTLVLSGANAFTGAVTVNAGTLTLSGANTFLGDVTLNAGTLNINNATALGNAANTLIINGGTITNTTGGTVTMINNNPMIWNAGFSITGSSNSIYFGSGAIVMTADIAINSTMSAAAPYFNGSISGNYNLIKNGNGNLVLAGANTFGGPGKNFTLNNGGYLYLDNNTALGNQNNTFIINGGGISISAASRTLAYDYPMQWNASFTHYSGNLTFGNGPITLGANVTVSVSNQSLTVPGNISGNYKLTKAGGNSLVLSGNNSYTGGTELNAGTLSFSNGSLSDTGNITFTGGTLGWVSGNTQDLSARIKNSASAIKAGIPTGTTVAFDSILDSSNVGGLTKSNSGILSLNAANTYGGSTTLSGGILNINNNTAISSGALILSGNSITLNNTSGGLVTLTNNNPITYSTSDPIIFTGTNDLNLGAGTFTLSGASSKQFTVYGTLTIGGVISGTNAFSKTATGTLVLNGANTFSGGINVYDGKVSFGHAQAPGTGTVTVVNSGISLDNTSGAPMTFTNNNAIVFGNSCANVTFVGSNDLDVGTGGVTWGSISGTTIIVSSHTLKIGGVISGAKLLAKGGAGTLTLSGANTFSNGMTLSAGTLNINHATAIGSGTFTISGGTIDNTSGAPITLSNNNAMTWHGDFAFAGTNDLNLGSGVPTLDANRIVTINAGTLTVGGAMTGGANARTLTKNGNGTLVVGASPGYMGSWTINAGTIRATAPLTLNTYAAQSLTINGVLDLNGNNLSVADTFVIGATGVLKMTGDETTSKNPTTITEGATIEYHATSDSRDIKNWTYTNATLWINGAGGTFTLPTNLTARGIDIDNGTLTQSSTHSITVGAANFDISNGNFGGGSGTVDINGNLVLSGGTFTSTSGQLQVSGNWTKSSGSFDANGGTVVFDGATPTISGSTTFRDFTTTTQDQAMSFNAGDTQTIAGAWTVTGAQDHLITLQRSGEAGQWNVNPQGSVNISYVTVSNSNNQGSAILPANSTNGGGNTGWFTVAPTVTTQAATTVLQTTIVANGTIAATGGANATVRGFKYGLTETDTWNSYDSGDFGAGAFTKTITGLSVNTTYYIRAYATNSIGTSYGSYVSFTTAQIPAVQFTTSSSSGAESTLSPSIEISIPSQSSENVSVNYAVTGGTATGSGTDYILASGAATITAGGTTTTLPLSIANDLADEVDETVIMTISSPTNATLGDNTAHTYTISDDDNPPNVTLSLSDSPLAENGGVAVVTATLSAVSGKNVTVNLAYSGTATNTTDYTRSGASIAIAAGGLTGTVSLTGVNDSLDEPDESIIVDIDSITNGTEATPQQVTAYITDDDGTPTIQFSVATASGSEATTSVTLTVNLSNASSQEVTANYTVTGTATGGGADYTLANGTATIAAEATSTTIPLTIVNDTLDENDETVIVTLSNPTNAGLGVNSAITYTIQDNDNPPVIQFSSTTSGNAESTTSVNIAVSLDVVSGLATSVQYALSGTATGSGTDYTLAAGTAEIATGETSVNIPVTIINDALDEDNETIILTLSNPTNSSLGSNTTHTYTITDNDATPSITFDTDAESGAESVTSKTITLSLSAVSGRNITVSYSVTGTATGAGTDYTLANGTAKVAAGQASTAIDLAIINDPTDEVDETVIVTISSPTNVTLGATTEYTYTITDNDNPPTVAFPLAASSGAEAIIAPTVAVTLSLASTKEITVAYTTSDGTAEATSDYTAAAGTLTFAAGETSKTITLAIADNGIVEVDETLSLILSDPTNASLGTNASHTYTITNDDTNPTGTLTVANSSGKTNTTTTTLSLTTDKATQMKLANTVAGIASTDYEAFATTKVWTLTPGTDGTRTVYLKLKDQYGNESEIISDTITLDTTAPATPTNLSAVSGNTSISLAWANPTDADFTNIAIFRSTTENFTPDLATNKIAATADATTATYLDTTALNNTTYYYAIKALDDADNYSVASAQVSGKPDSDNPTTPGALTISDKITTLDSKEIVNKKEITFAWAKSNDDNSGVKSYTLAIGTNSGTDNILSKEIAVSDLANPQIPNTKYQLPSDGTYYARIQAKDNLGNTSSYSAELVFIVDTTAPIISGKLDLYDVSDRSAGVYVAALVWPKAVEEGSGLLGYQLTRNGTPLISGNDKITPGIQSSLDGSTLSYLDTLAADQTVSYTIKAIDNATTESAQLASSLIPTETVTASGQKEGSSELKLVSSIIGEGKLELSEIIATPSQYAGTKTQAQITWKTTVPATSEVRYGPGAEYSLKTPQDLGLNSSHTIILTDLTPNTTYHYQAISKDKHGNEVKSLDQTFTTNQQVKQQSILDIIIQNITDVFGSFWNSVKNLFSFSNDPALAADSTPIIKLSVINISTPGKPGYAIYWPKDKGIVTLERREGDGQFTNLLQTDKNFYLDADVKAGTVYSYRLNQETAQASDELSGQPTISDIKIEPGLATKDEASLIVTFKTDKLAKSQIFYGSSTNYENKTEINPALNQSHTILIEHLKPNTTYNLKLVASDKNGANMTESSNQTITTATSPSDQNLLEVIAKYLEQAFSGFDGWMKR